MPEEQTVSAFTWITPPLRNRLRVHRTDGSADTGPPTLFNGNKRMQTFRSEAYCQVLRRQEQDL
ncbi:hypothetical protein BDZ97DRAFT_1782487 [Flammula alnicola]|nr:hypothetical protein BDZ97DRAFT_1810720 [Flammula alnicola]KAF8972751.1 hypothetical protein BDZ97DRAFT_1782487 [Flammula alnicola]